LPYKLIDDIKIYYEIHGPSNGFPLVLFAGWGQSMWMWFKQLPALNQKYRVIVIDNRGAGKTSKPDKPYSIELFSSDAKRLLDTLGINKTHVLGHSMGGYIALQFAISYPNMVNGLVVSSTRFGGGPKSNAVMATDDITAKMLTIPTETISQEQADAIKRSTVFSKPFIKENQALLKQMDTWRNENPQPLYALIRQTEAAMAFDVEIDLNRISCPTLILHGEKDLAVPVVNAEMMHEKIANSKLIIFQNSPHRIEIERYKDFNRSILEFLSQVDDLSYTPKTEPIKI
jgi:pimeloyl-ACP methyl ester carboxylesterase